MAFIAIIAMTIVVIFIVVMDILTYCFGIDLTSTERERLRQKNYMKNKKSTSNTRNTSVNVSMIQLFERSTSTLEERII